MIDSILIVADRIHQLLYRGLPLTDKRFSYCAFHDLDFQKLQISGNGNAFDLIVLDSGFNASRGLELLTAIKSLFPSTPVIFLTDASSEDLAIRAFRAGAREYFSKPFQLLDFCAVIERIVMIRKSSGERRKALTANEVSSGKSFMDEMLSDTHASIFRSLHYIRSNFLENITIERLAEEANLSRYHFCRLFKKHVGVTPMQLVMNMRIERAKKLLHDRNLSVATVAAASGFNDPNSFARHFKKSTGETPSSYHRNSA